MKKQMQGITLIALVITIIILLILTGISISLTVGNNGVITKSRKAAEEHCHASIKEAVAMAYLEYQTDIIVGKKNEIKVASTKTIKMAETSKSKPENFFEFMEQKGYINEQGIINTKNLLGNKTLLGNGTGTKDVYKLEEEYVVNYYGKNDEKRKIWSDSESSNKSYITVEFRFNSPVMGNRTFELLIPNGWTFNQLAESDIYIDKIRTEGWTIKPRVELDWEEKYIFEGKEITEEEYNEYKNKLIADDKTYFYNGKEITEQEYKEYEDKFDRLYDEGEITSNEYDEYYDKLTWTEKENPKYYYDGSEITTEDYYEILNKFQIEDVEVERSQLYWSGDISEENVLGTSTQPDEKIPDGFIFNSSHIIAECVFPNSGIAIDLSGGVKRAEEVSKGDKIVYYNFETEKNEEGIVSKVYVHKRATDFVRYVLDDGKYLESTDYHPIYTEVGWKSLTNRKGYLKPNIGENVKTTEGWKKITKIETWQGEEDCYDFAITNKDGKIVNNYYANGILVQGSY